MMWGMDQSSLFTYGWLIILAPSAERLDFDGGIAFALLLQIIWAYIWVYFQALNSVHWSMCLSLCQYHSALIAVILKKSGHLSSQSAQRRGHRLRVRETGFDPGCAPAYSWSGTASSMQKDREMESSLHALPAPPLSGCFSMSVKSSRQTLWLFSGLLLLPGEAEEFPLWRAPDLLSDLGLVEAVPFQSPVKAIPWTSSPDGLSPGHPAGPHVFPDSVMDKPSLRSFKCDQLWSWECSHPCDLPNCCPCHDVGRKLGH